MIPQSKTKMDEHVKKCRGKMNPPPPPPPSPSPRTSDGETGPAKDPSLVLNLEQTVDQELNESEASYMPSTQPSQQTQEQPIQDQTADESMFFSVVTVASTQDAIGQDVVGHEVSKQVKRLRTSPQKGVKPKTPRTVSVKEQQVYNEIAILESEIEADEAEAMAREYGNKEVERRLEERNVKNENQEYLDNNKDISTSTNGSSVVEVGRVYTQDNNRSNESVNLLSNSDGDGNFLQNFTMNVQQENELLKEMQEKLEKANKVAADYINANNILKSENSHLKMVEEDLEDKNQDLEKRNADLKIKLDSVDNLHGIDVRNTMKLHEKLKNAESENQRMVTEMTEKDDVIHGLRRAERDLSEQIKEGERREAMMKKMVKERDEEKAKMFSFTEKQKKIIDWKEEVILKLHGEAEQNSNRLQAYREREQDLTKKLEVVQKELDDCKQQIKVYRQSNEVTVESHSQVVRSNEIL